MAQKSLLNFFAKRGSISEPKQEDSSALINGSSCVPDHRVISKKRSLSPNNLNEQSSPPGKENATRRVGTVKLSPHTPHTARVEQRSKRQRAQRVSRTVVDDDCDWEPGNPEDGSSPLDEEWNRDTVDGSTTAELHCQSKRGDGVLNDPTPLTAPESTRPQEQGNRNSSDSIHESDPAAKRKFLEAVGEECEFAGGSSAAGAWAEARAKFDWLQPQNIVDGSGKRPGETGFDSRTVRVPKAVFDKLSASQKQYWSTKCKYMDTVLFFKVVSEKGGGT